MEELFTKICTMTDSVDQIDDLPNPAKASLFFHHQCLSRNKRCVCVMYDKMCVMYDTFMCHVSM